VIGVTFIYKLSSINGYMNPVTMILSGIVLNIFASSLIGFLKYYFALEELKAPSSETDN